MGRLRDRASSLSVLRVRFWCEFAVSCKSVFAASVLCGSSKPSSQPTSRPSSAPSVVPSTTPTNVPSTTPTAVPSIVPTGVPSRQPTTSKPTLDGDTHQPTVVPTTAPSLYYLNYDTYTWGMDYVYYERYKQKKFEPDSQIEQ